jgi:hypothetical protein
VTDETQQDQDQDQEQETRERELTDAELDGVAGGGMFWGSPNPGGDTPLDDGPMKIF